jgi:hypothetical protein
LRWASSEDGLGLPIWWAWLAFVALDAAAVVCVGMVTLAAWRGESGGMFELLTWMFAAGSAWANYRHGLTTSARDDQYFFPAMSLAGPLLLHVTLARVRRWYRVDSGRQSSARPRFGLRWLPGVAFRQTLRAWQAAIREGIERPDAAVGHVRERDMLRRLSPRDQVHLAWQALGHTGPHAARAWLAAREIFVEHDDLVAAYEDLRPAAVEVSVDLTAAQPSAEPGGAGAPTTGAEVEVAPEAMEAWQRRRLSVAVGLLQSDPDLPLAELASGLQAHGHEVTERVAARIHAEAVEFLRAETSYAS